MREILNVNKSLIYVYKLHNSTGKILLRVLGMIKVVLQGHANYFFDLPRVYGLPVTRGRWSQVGNLKFCSQFH